jgi:sugar/nucleoside kinase (ribokinase family)
VAPRLIVIGDCNPDLVLSGNARPRFDEVEVVVDEARLAVGGSASITACAAARLGLECSLLAAVGDDALGRIQTDAVRAAGVDGRALVVDPDHATGMTVVLAEPGDRAILTAPGASGRLSAPDVDTPLLAAADHVHVSSWFLLESLRPDLPSLLGAAHAAGTTVSLDTNYDPSRSWEDGDLRRALDAVDVLLPNLAEACALSGEAEPLAAARALARTVPTAVVKLGAEGAVAVSSDRAVAAVPPRVSVADTTGAGDNFNAGFLAGMLAGRPLDESLRLAVACGALSTRCLGGTAAQPDLEQATEFAASVSVRD